MNDKLVIRAATCFHEWMQRCSRESVAEHGQGIRCGLESVEGKAGQIREWGEKFLIGITPRIQTEVGNEEAIHTGITCRKVCANITSKMIPELESRLRVELDNALSKMKALVGEEACHPLPVKQAIQELTIINNEWDEVSFRGGILSVPICNISLDDGTEEVDLGDFVLRLNLNYSVEELRVQATDPVEGAYGLHHPHIKEEKLCAGDGKDMMKNALRQGRLEDYFRIVEAIVRTYNDDSPHKPLSDWYAPENQSGCNSCGDSVSQDGIYSCDRCGSDFCESCNCLSECMGGCGEYVCDECCSYCESCENTICVGCATTCSDCHNINCSDCLQECSFCTDQSCSNCSFDCKKCNDSMCSECKKECGVCENIYCEDCLTSACSDCETLICENCAEVCEDCKKTICGECSDNSCEHCGTSMCKSCGDNHSCLLAEVSN